MLEITGIPTRSDLEKFLPSNERRMKGPYAFFECFEEIPCDPCYEACPFKAVKEFSNLNDVPEVDFDKCTGCGLCVFECPGLAIFLIDESIGEGKAQVTIPYEFLPLPELGEVVQLANREGLVVGEGKVVRLKKSGQKGKTTAVTVEIPLSLVMDVRHIYLKR